MVGVDVGTRRIGVAVSDATGTLARPLTSITVSGLDRVAIDRVADVVKALSLEDEGVSTLVVGLPRRLDGRPNDLTAAAATFATRLAYACALPLAFQDERLSSLEADERLSAGRRGWRARKARLDAAAAAVILQDYLDRQGKEAPAR